MAKYVHLSCGTVQVVVCLAMLGISIGSWASAEMKSQSLACWHSTIQYL